MHAAQDALRNARGAMGGLRVFDADRTEQPEARDPGAPVREALAEHRLRLMGQTAYRVSDHRALHLEVIARLYDAQGREMAAAQFLPVIVAQKLSEPLDRAVIEKVLRDARAGSERISVNVSARSLEQPGFVAWLGQLLMRERRLAARLTFELAEHGVVRNEAAAAEFARAVSAAGAAFAIDHFGIHRDCLALLQRLHPAYVKLAGVQVRRALADSGAHFFAESLVRAARQLDIPVIAQHVEDETVFQGIASLGFAGYQGNLGGSLRPWPDATAPTPDPR
jgi:EAL domain-containing protein (putative c-di-GMP-specific phosphodiesterase class I)